MLYMHTRVQHFFIFAVFSVDKSKKCMYNEDKRYANPKKKGR